MVSTGLPARELQDVPEPAQRPEALGVDGVPFGELAHDRFQRGRGMPAHCRQDDRVDALVQEVKG